MKTKKPLRKKKHSQEETPEGMDPVRSPEPSTLSGNAFTTPPRQPPRGTGAEYAGQSGDLQDLPSRPSADSESVEELVAEGQYREAEIVAAVEESDQDRA